MKTRQHWLFRAVSILTLLTMVSTYGVPLAQAANLREANDARARIGLSGGQGVPIETSSGVRVQTPADAGGSSRQARASQPLVPASVELISADDPKFDATRLFDARDTGLPRGAFRVKVHFASKIVLSNAASFSRSDADHLDGTLSVWSEEPGRATAKKVLEIAVRPGVVGWQRGLIASPFSTASVVVDWVPRQPGGATPSELSLWALIPLPTVSSVDLADRLVAGTPAELVELWASPKKAAIGAKSKNPLNVELGVDPHVFTRAFLVYELLGARHFTQVERKINGFSALPPLPARGQTARPTEREALLRSVPEASRSKKLLRAGFRKAKTPFRSCRPTRSALTSFAT